MPEFVDQIIAALHPEALPLPPVGEIAEEHGAQRLGIGFDVGEVVREYGLLHRCILDLAGRAAFTPDLREQRIVARWLSTGVADAVAQYGKQRDIERQRQTSEHLGFIAHELRSPLSTACLAFARLRPTAPAESARWADVLDRNLRRTVDLIDGVLGQASLQLGVEPAITRLDLKTFLQEIVADAEAESQSRGISVTLSAGDGIALDADPRLMRSAVSNLLNNALKFSRPRLPRRSQRRPERGPAHDRRERFMRRPAAGQGRGVVPAAGPARREPVRFRPGPGDRATGGRGAPRDNPRSRSARRRVRVHDRSAGDAAVLSGEACFGW